MTVQTPDWVKHAVFYQIFPDRFSRVVPSVASPAEHVPLETWDAPPTFGGYKGGNLWGVIERLDYLKDLGISAIYFTPIFQSTSNHRYHTHDYYHIDPLLGGDAAFDALLDAAHARQIRIVLDGVFNHTGRGFFYFNDILENGPQSPWLDWFRIDGWPLSAYDGSLPANYQGWANNRALPAFNHDNPQAREYIMQVGEYWVQKGIDGWRLDVPYEVKAEGFWQEFRQRIKAINPEAYIVGEVWGDATEWLDGSQFDAVMNYPLTAATIAFTGGDRVLMDQVRDRAYEPYPAINAPDYAQQLQDLLHQHDWQIQLTQLNLLDSHDTARLLSIVGGDRATVRLATLLMFALPGAPCIYYGDEIGMKGGVDPDCRSGFLPEDQWEQDVLDYHRRLIVLRHQYPALRIGAYKELGANGNLVAFARQLDAGDGTVETLIIAVNAGETPAEAGIPTDGLQVHPSRVVYGEGKVTWEDATLNLTIPARQGIILAV
ncbi:MAG: glycoside hydrolase family 13 protein [Cyanobacteria bacterium J06638_22]